MANNGRTYLVMTAAMMGVMLAVSPGAATQFIGERSVFIADTIEINDDVFVSGQSANVHGHVRGDLFLFGVTARFGGEVDGSVAAGVYDFNMTGRCRNSIRVLARGVAIDGHIERNLIAFGENVVIGRDGWIEKDVHFGVSSLTIQGRIGGKVKGKGEQIFISGQIDGDVDVEGKDLIIQPTAIIGGSLNFCSKEEPKIEPGAQILGQVTHSLPGQKEKAEGYTLGDFLIDSWSYLALVLAGGIMLAFCGGFAGEVTVQIKTQWLKSLLLGLVFVVCLPMMAVILLITLIGIPLGLIVLAVWLVLFYLAKVFGGIVIADWLLRKLRRGQPPRVFWAMVLGVAIVVAFMNVPYVGLSIKLVCVLLTFGGFFLAAAERHVKTHRGDGVTTSFGVF